MNAQGVPETVSMRAFASSAWEPGNPGNPAVARANEAYRRARLEILTEAARRPTATFEGWECDDRQKKVLINDLSGAVSKVNAALEKLRLAQGGVQAELKQVALHFKTQSPEDLASIIANFSRVRDELGNVTDFSCGGTICEVKDLVYWRLFHAHVLGWAIKSGGAAAQINICKGYWGLAESTRVLNVIHEATHKAFGTADYSYALNLPREEALKNAATYAIYASGW